ncbi:MAG TPA: radical SAM family heme chaperone HemW [Terriglobales bacterium]|nr:radical SAM family heme chaperone HemW [Terriglobales bacterium]
MPWSLVLASWTSIGFALPWLWGSQGWPPKILDACRIPGVSGSGIIVSMALGLYISLPFCRTKCSYCNFASHVFPKAVFASYVARVCQDLARASALAEQMGGHFERAVDSIYFGGGTPTLLDRAHLERLFFTIAQNFEIQPSAEVTVECAPGTLSPEIIDVFSRSGVNRASLGVQSFVDQEAASVGRLHHSQTVFDDIARLRSAGIANINLDLIAGLPHQSCGSWRTSLDRAIASQVPHLSVYMLEVDEDSRLGRELIAGGTRYHAQVVPDEDQVADFYGMACEQLQNAGVEQYEISNFARPGYESHHNLKYWSRQPYLGFGVDAHSMLNPARAGVEASGDGLPRTGPAELAWRAAPGGGEAVRFATPDSLDDYLAAPALKRTFIDHEAALEETFFLGLRLNGGADLERIAAVFGISRVAALRPTLVELVQAGLLEQEETRIRLTPRGRLLSNEVFERFLSPPSRLQERTPSSDGKLHPGRGIINAAPDF